MNKFRVVLFGIFISLLLIACFSCINFSNKIKNEKELFSKIKLGMTKSQIIKIVGNPYKIDSSNTALERWYFDVDPLFADQPRLEFGVNDSILIKFEWEAIKQK